MTTLRPKPIPENDPPPVRRRPARRILVITSSVVLALLLLIVVFKIDRPRGGPAEEEEQVTTSPVAGPNRLTDEEIALESDPARRGEPTAVSLSAGAWIEVPDPDDPERLAQRYRFARMDPNPEGQGPGWFAMDEPQVEVFLADDRVLKITGRTALVSAPNNALERGRITDDVEIQLFESRDDLNDDLPSMLLQTKDASFDNILGEIRCDEQIMAETRTVEFAGERLRLLINDREQKVSMRIETVDHIRLAASAAESGGVPARGTDPLIASNGRAATGEAVTATEQRSRAEHPVDALPERQRTGTQQDAVPSGDDVQYYIVTMSDDVRIRQGDDEASGRLVTGDRLEIVFSTASEGVGGSLTRTDDQDRSVLRPIARPLPEIMLRSLAASTDGRDGPVPRLSPPRDLLRDTFVTCTGGLTMTPYEPGDDESPPDPRDTVATLTGDPVVLRDHGEDAYASGARLRYHTTGEIIELIGSGRHPLQVRSPELDAHADRFWISLADRTGGLDGGGWLLAGSRDPEPTDSGEATPSPTRVAWQDRVALTFHETDEPGGLGLGQLRSATFFESVQVDGDDLHLTGDEVGIEVPADARARGTVERVRAKGDVQIRSVGQSGDMRCGAVDLFLQITDDGRTMLREMNATGDVQISDATQSIWANDLQVTFQVIPVGAAEGASSDLLGGRGDVAVDRLLAQDDVRVQLADGTRIHADMLEADQRTQRLELLGWNVTVASGRLLADRGRRVVVVRGEGRAFWEGNGRARIFGEDIGADLEHLPSPDVTMTWMDGVDFTLIESAGDGEEGEVRLRDATFNGGVNVEGEAFWFNTDQMLLAFPEGDSEADIASGSGAIERMIATGHVHVGSTADQGTMTCDALDLQLVQSDDGRTAPQTMIASGGVVANNPDQTVWAERVDVTFGTPQVDGADRSEGTPADVGREDVERVEATGNVHVWIKGGGRAWCDTLIGHPKSDSVELLGDAVIVTREELLIDEATHVVLWGEDRRAEWKGAGRARVFGDSIEPVGDGRLEVSSIASTDGLPPVLVTWAEGMTYDDRFNNDSGRLEFRGDVSARMEPEPTELSTMSGQLLGMEFERVTSVVDTAIAAVEVDGAGRRGLSFEQAGGERRLAVLTAEGGAELESRTWQRADRQDVPSVFYVAGESIRYDDRTMEATIEGEGTLLIRDVKAGAGEGPAGDVAFGANGVTRFRWSDRFELRRAFDDRFDITMAGNVRGEHQAVDGAISTIVSNRLDAVVQREAEEVVVGEVADELSPIDDDARGPLELGGQWRMKRIACEGGVAIRTPTRDVRCDSFDYNLLTRLARISARPGRRASILTRGTARPIQAENVLWNMDQDTLTIMRASGAGSTGG